MITAEIFAGRTPIVDDRHSELLLQDLYYVYMYVVESNVDRRNLV